MAETAAQKKARLAAAATAAKQKAAAEAKFQADKAAAKKARLAEEAAAIAANPDDTYAFTKVGTTGKTQAQLDAAANATAVAKSIGGTVDPKTGYVIPKDAADVAADAAAAKAAYDAAQLAAAKKAEEEAAKRDAFALVQDTMRSYGFTNDELKEITTFIESQIIDPNIGPNMAILNMRNLGAYKKRFSGNDALLKAGKNALSEYDYLQQENAYDEYFNAYGVSNLSTRAQKATLIGNSVSALEVDKRLNLAVNRVKNSDPEILKQLKAYYPNITDKDLVSYFLNPEATRVDLERKVTASEISSAAVGQGFKSTGLSALGLADYGVDRTTAVEGYANIAGVLPETTKLGDIYGETGIKYDQMTGEEEFLKASDAAKRKRNVLASKERATFEGSAGNAPGAYSTGYLKKSSVAGLI
jgi:hypothetical protein